MKPLEQLTKEIFECPTAPFREMWVLEQIERELIRLKSPYFFDSFGNLIAGARGPAEVRRKSRVGLIAHTDHPGFHIVHREKSGLWKARWYGGGPGTVMKGARARIHFPRFPKRSLLATIVRSEGLGKDKRGCDWIWLDIDPARTLEQKNLHQSLNQECFGAFDFPSYRRIGKTIFTPAADDLSGCVTILATLERLTAKERRSFVGIFTRAEEVGFRGTLAVLYKNVVPDSLLAISLEASRTLPGARLGKGPVIRLGDRRTLFDSQIILALDTASAGLMKKHKGFKTQRRIMDGGTCEATAFNLYGRRTAGVAVPLGNYHNQGRGKPAPEYIDFRDLESSVLLCTETVRNLIKNPKPMGGFDQALREGFKKDTEMLRRKIPFLSRQNPDRSLK